VGLLFLIIPNLGIILFAAYGIYMALSFILAAQVLVIENKGIIESMKRSWELTKGRKLRIAGFLLVIFVISYILNQLSGSIMLELSRIIGLSGIWIGAVISFFITSLILPFSACVYVLIYFNARIDKEGFALEHLADQFLPEEEEESPVK
jgi:membrane-anchored glycerophosphoryl diester phosphodiesterase (GDPDase)